MAEAEGPNLAPVEDELGNEPVTVVKALGGHGAQLVVDHHLVAAEIFLQVLEQPVVADEGGSLAHGSGAGFAPERIKSGGT